MLYVIVDKAFSQKSEAHLANAIMRNLQNDIEAKCLFAYRDTNHYVEKIFLKLFGFKTPNLFVLFKILTIKNSSILFFKPNYLPTFVCRMLRYRNNRLIWYSGDNPSKSWNVTGFGKRNFRQFELYITINIKSYIDHLEHNCLNYVAIDKGATRQQIENSNELTACVDKSNGVIFIGSYDKFREEFFKQIYDLGVKVDIYGNDWDKAHKLKGIQNLHFMPVPANDIPATVNRYSIALNLLRVQNDDTQNTKSYELPLGKVLIISDYSETQKKLIGNGEYLIKSQTPLEYAQVISRAIQDDEFYKNSIKTQQAYYQESIRTFDDMASEILEFIKK